MKSQIAIFVLVLFVFAGCTTNPVLFSSFADEYNFSSIAFKNTFNAEDPNLTFVSYNGQSLPKPEKETYWDPINFPSDTKLRIVVHANYYTSSQFILSGFGLLGVVVNTVQEVRAVSRNVNADVIFICPPLEAGRNYMLSFTKEPGIPGKNILTLIDTDTLKVIEQQEFEVVFGGDKVK